MFYKEFFRTIDLINYEEQTFQCSNRIMHSVQYLANICKYYRPILDGIECDVRSMSILFAVPSKGWKTNANLGPKIKRAYG